jgi:hypothetical protein
MWSPLPPSLHLHRCCCHFHQVTHRPHQIYLNGAPIALSIDNDDDTPAWWSIVPHSLRMIVCCLEHNTCDIDLDGGFRSRDDASDTLPSCRTTMSSLHNSLPVVMMIVGAVAGPSQKKSKKMPLSNKSSRANGNHKLNEVVIKRMNMLISSRDKSVT